MLSNAVTKVKIKIGENEEERTVAEAINMKNNSMMFKRQMLDRMQQQLSQAQAKTNKENEILESKSENYVTGLFGQKEGKTSTDEVTKAKQQYIDLNTWALIDPINVQNKIRVLSDEISSFEAEVDSVLSTSNALTIVKDYMEKNNLKDDSELPDYFVTAQTLDYKNRIYMQSVWQTHIDASISSTVNVPNDFTVEQVEGLYMTAWEAGLKGVTIFRDGCKRAGILTTSDSKKDDETSEKPKTTLGRGMIIKADDNCVGKKRTLQTGCGTLHCEAFFDPDTGELLETYLSKGSSGGCNQFMIGLSRMISLAARGGIDIYSIIDQLKSSGTCPSYAVRTATKHDTSKGSCCPVAIGNALIDMYKEMQDEISDDSEEIIDTPKQPKKKIVANATSSKCPQCGGNLVFEGGCNTCKDCGWSKCD